MMRGRLSCHAESDEPTEEGQGAEQEQEHDNKEKGADDVDSDTSGVQSMMIIRLV